MADVTAAMVKELRDLTGAGIMACKNALVENDGDMDKAVEALRKSGEAKAVKKASRIAAEGIVKVLVDGNTAVVVEVNSETDFVAKNEKFQNFVTEVAKQIATGNAKDVEGLLAEPWAAEPEKTVNDALINMIATIGEKMTIRRFEKVVSDGVLVPYIHGGGRIGVLVEADCENNEANQEALKNIAMQVAAMNPEYITRDDMSQEALDKLKEITVESALNTPDTLPKPILLKLIARACDEKVWSDEDIAIYGEQKNNMNYLFNFLSDEAKTQLAGLANQDRDTITTDKIFVGAVEGRFAKQLKEICLVDQVYVKAEDGKQSVGAYLKGVDANLKLKKFIRFETGEGIQKKEENFAEEVAKQMNQ